MMAWPRVSVVVPSGARPELLHAVASVHAQDYPGEVETVVVLDGGGDHADLLARLSTAGVTVRETGRRAGADVARNLGATAATGELVAYLDDDDVWEPDKLRTQVELLRRLGGDGQGPLVVSCRVRFRRPGGSELSRPVPDRLPTPGQRVEDYLFRRRRPTLGRALVQTSTLLLPRELALAVPWDEQLTRHQDWDWVTRAQDEAGARLVMCPAPLVVCATGSTGSISARPDWASSLAWAVRRGEGWLAGTRADFLVGQPLRYALQARSLTGVGRVLAAVATGGRPPSPLPLVIGLGGLLPRRTFEAAALRSGRQRPGAADRPSSAGNGARRRVSVIMAVHEPGDGVLAALDRLGRTLGDDDELIVVDDGSTDGTADRVRGRLRRHRAGAWQVLALPDNRGVAVARNEALRHTSGELVWFVDWDDTWDPGILDRLRTALDTTGATVAVCGADHVDAHGVRLRRLGARPRRPLVLEGPRIGLAVLDGDVQGYLWNKLFTRSVLGPEPFPAQRSQSDFVGTAGLLAAQRRVVVLPDVLYAHVRRPGSLTNTTYPSMTSFDRSLEVAGEIAEELARTAADRPARQRVARALLGFRYREHHLTVANTALRLSHDDDYRHAMLARALDGMRWRDVAALGPGSPVLAARAAVLLAAGVRYPLVYDAYTDLRRLTYRWRRPRHAAGRDGLRW